MVPINGLKFANHKLQQVVWRPIKQFNDFLSI